MGSDKKTDFDFNGSAWSRRRFMRDVTLGGGAVLFASQGQGLAQVLRQTQGNKQAQGRGQGRGRAGMVQRARGMSPSEAQLHSIAASDPALHAVLADALAYAKYSVAVAAAGEAQGSGNTLVAASRAFLSTRKPKARAAYEASVKSLLSGPTPRRQAEFGRYAEVSPAEFATRDRASLVKQVQPARAFSISQINVSALQKAGFIHMDPDAMAEAEAKREAQAAQERQQERQRQQDLAEGAKYKHIEFLVQRIRCIEASGGALEGTDEITFGGVTVGGNGGVHKFSLRAPFENFDDGRSYEYPAPGYAFFTYDIFKDPFPREYIVTVSMSEVDDGGFGDFLQQLWEDIGGYVTSTIASGAAGTAIGAAIGSIIPGLGTIIGAIIGALFGWLINLFDNEDDIIGTRTAVVGLRGAAKSNYDRKGLDSPQGIPFTLDFPDDGHYQMDCAFRAVKA